MIRTCTPLALASALLACNSATTQRPSDGSVRDVVDAASDVVRVDVQRPVDSGTPFDAGPSPTCALTAMARHVLDRPAGNRPPVPSALVRTGNGFLTAMHREVSDLDDGGVPRTVSDTIDTFAFDTNGTPTGPSRTVYDALPSGTALDTPVLLRSPSGAFVVFQESQGTAGDPDFAVRLRATAVDAMGAGPSAEVLRENHSRAQLASLTNGNYFGIAPRIEPIGDSGAVIATPRGLLLGPDGSNVGDSDRNLSGFVPIEADTLLLRTAGDGSGLVFRVNGTLGFNRFDAQGDFTDGKRFQTLAVPSVSDVAYVHDAFIGAWTRSRNGAAEVHVFVAAVDGTVRRHEELESIAGQGTTEVSVQPAHGGAALFWRSGRDADAKVRVAVVAPDGMVITQPTDLVSAPGLNGRIVAHVDGRAVHFIAPDGASATDRGLTFGRACLP